MATKKKSEVTVNETETETEKVTDVAVVEEAEVEPEVTASEVVEVEEVNPLEETATENESNAVDPESAESVDTAETKTGENFFDYPQGVSGFAAHVGETLPPADLNVSASQSLESGSGIDYRKYTMDRIAQIIGINLNKGRSSAAYVLESAENVDSNRLRRQDVENVADLLAEENIAFQFYEKGGEQKVQFSW